MIKDIFIPERVGSYFIFPQIIVGLEISKHYIRASKIKAQAKNRTVVSCSESYIESHDDEAQAIQKTLSRVLKDIGSYDKIYLALSSSIVVFKHIIIDFIDAEKVRNIVPFEIENQLPFTLNNAIIDSIVTYEDTNTKQSHVLVSAVTKKNISYYLDIFTEQHISLDKITVDMIELYAFFQHAMHKNIDEKKAYALVDIDLYSVRIALIINQQLTFVRTLSKGLKYIAERIASHNEKSVSDTIEEFIRFGVQSSNESSFEDLVNDITFTINTMLKQAQYDTHIYKVFLSGFGADIKGMSDLICRMIESDCAEVELKKLLQQSGVTLKYTSLKNKFLMSTATALPWDTTQQFNLIPDKQERQKKVLSKQITALIILSLLIIGSFTIYSFIQTSYMNKAYKKSTTQAISKLKEYFDIKEKRSLKQANQQAQQKFNVEKQAVSRIVNKSTYSFLMYLDELSHILDKKRLGLVFEKVSMNPSSITIQGSVKNMEAAKILENAFKQSQLFTLKAALQTPDFTKTPLIVDINKDRFSEQ
jgi:site-specific recombinase XerD